MNKNFDEKGNYRPDGFFGNENQGKRARANPGSFISIPVLFAGSGGLFNIAKSFNSKDINYLKDIAKAIIKKYIINY